jgi:hypothetical protein
MLLGNIQVLEFFFNELIVGNGIVFESLGPEVSGRDSKVIWTLALVLKLLLKIKSLVHS